MKEEKKYLGVELIGWSVILSNAVLALIIFVFPHIMAKIPFGRKIFEIIAMLAVFPYDFFRMYLSEAWLTHMAWMIIVTLAAQGIMLFNRFGRMVFIVLNVVHIAILATIVVMKFGTSDFLDYFFKLYFNLVASGTYVGFVTMREIRSQYQLDPSGKKIPMFFHKPKIKQPAPGDANGFLNLGLAYNQMERYDDAIEALEKSLSINDRSANGHYQLGLTYMHKKDYGRAVSSFGSAVKIDPIHAKAYFHMGLTLRKQGCNSEAIDAFKKVVNISPDDKDIYRELGNAYAEEARFEEAMISFQKAVELNPQDDESHCQIGIIYLTQMEKYDEARNVLKKTIRLRPAHTQAHFQLGMACLKLNRFNDAIRSFKEVLKLDRDNKQAHFQLGFTYAMIQDYPSAKREQKYLQNVDTDLANTLSMLIK